VPFKFRKYYSDQAVKILTEFLKSNPGFDFIVIDHYHLVPLVFDTRRLLIRMKSACPRLILRTPNVESSIVNKTAERIDNPMVKAFASREARKMSEYEAKTLGDFDLVAAISPVDQVTLVKNSRKPAKVVSVTGGMYPDQLLPSNVPPDPREVVLVGSFDWHPNVDGALWLIKKVWPLVLKEVHDAHLTLVGRKPPPSLESLACGNIAVTGQVPSVEEYINKASCSVVPLWIGSGMRYKILESFSLAKAVVSTTLGAEGIELENGKHILISDKPDGFAEAVIKILMDTELRDTLGQNARKLVEEKYSWPVIARGFSKILETM
jgi:polysaccharide biosynthesis protein PslH